MILSHGNKGLPIIYEKSQPRQTAVAFTKLMRGSTLNCSLKIIPWGQNAIWCSSGLISLLRTMALF